MMTNGVFKDRVDFIRYVKQSEAKNKSDLANILTISRPTLYKLIDDLSVDEGHLSAIFDANSNYFGGKEYIDRQLLTLYPDCKIERFYFRFQELIVVNDTIIYRAIGKKPKPLPIIFRGDTEYYSWSFDKKQITIKRANLLFMLLNGVKEIEKGRKVIFANGDEKDYRNENLVLVSTSKISREGQAKFLKELRNRTKIVSPESLEKFVSDYFDL